MRHPILLRCRKHGTGVASHRKILPGEFWWFCKRRCGPRAPSTFPLAADHFLPVNVARTICMPRSRSDHCWRGTRHSLTSRCECRSRDGACCRCGHRARAR
jgi:hypothetical protein